MTPNPLRHQKPPAARLPLPYWLQEFGMVRNAVLSFAAVLALGVGCMLASAALLRHETLALEQAQRQRSAAAARLAQVDQEKRDIGAFQQRFIALRERGLVGEERRLEWVEAIRQAQERRQLPPLSYEIEPRQALRLSGAVDLGDYQPQGSRMRLHMGLIHDMDLFNFLDDLHQHGYFAVQDCTIKRVATASAASSGGAAPTLGADCTLNWITLTGGTPSPGGGRPASPMLAVAPAPMAPPLGRLFATPAERDALDASRAMPASAVAAMAGQGAGNDAAAMAPPSDMPLAPGASGSGTEAGANGAGEAAPAPRQLELNGVLRSSAGRTTVWLNNEASSGAQNRFSNRDSKAMSVTLPSGKRVRLQPGQRYDLDDGQVKDLLQP